MEINKELTKHAMQLFMKPFLSIIVLVLSLSACSGGSSSQQAPEPVVIAPPPPPVVKREFLWPLCGHITQTPPLNYQASDGCPDTRWNENFSDFPLSSTFGPRQKASESFRYDFHRGIDIPTDFGSPIFAVKAGLVTRAGSHPQFVDLGVTLQHYDESTIDCDSSACIHSLYIHMSDVIVSEGSQVEKGQLLGYSGSTPEGIDHLHFEIRQSPGQHDPLSAWQRDAIHPLAVLPLFENEQDDYSIAFSNVLLGDNNELSFVSTISSSDSQTLAFARMEVEVFEKQSDNSLILIEQPGNLGVSNLSPEGIPYYVNPSWYDIALVNQQFTYKDSTLYPWSAFQVGGVYESPYANLMPDVYTPNIHLDRASTVDAKIGEFNGKLIAPAAFSSSSQDYQLAIEYQNLLGPAEFSTLCIRARTIDAKGKVGSWFEFQCP